METGQPANQPTYPPTNNTTNLDTYQHNNLMYMYLLKIYIYLHFKF